MKPPDIQRIDEARVMLMVWRNSAVDALDYDRASLLRDAHVAVMKLLHYEEARQSFEKSMETDR